MQLPALPRRGLCREAQVSGFTITNPNVLPPPGRPVRVRDARGRVWDVYIDRPRPACGCEATHVHSPIGCLAVGCNCKERS